MDGAKLRYAVKAIALFLFFYATQFLQRSRAFPQHKRLLRKK